MKFFIFLIVGMAIVTASCKKSMDDSAPAAATTITDVKAVVPGSWTVRTYRQRSEDKTSDFRNMSFVFSADGTLTVTEGSKTSRGTWTSSPASVTYYGGSGVATLTINMGKSKPFDKVSKTWNINAGSTTSALKLDYPEPAEDEHLEFTK